MLLSLLAHKGPADIFVKENQKSPASCKPRLRHRYESEINLRHKDVVLALAAAPCRKPTFDAAIDTPVTSTAFQVGCTNDNDEVPSAVRQSHGLNAAARQNPNDAQLGEHKS